MKPVTAIASDGAERLAKGQAVTVLVPLYNGIEFLEECLTSVKEQVFTDWTCVVGVNGHGDDGGDVYKKAVSIVEKLSDPRFSVINLPGIKGAPDAINELVIRSKTEWVAHLDADDKWDSMKLHCQMRLIEGDKEGVLSVIGTFALYFGEWGLPKGPSIPGEAIHPDMFKRFNPMIHSSIVIRKELAHYSNEFLGVYDYDCWCKLTLQGKRFFNIPLDLTWHRVYKQSAFNASGLQRPELVRAKYFPD